MRQKKTNTLKYETKYNGISMGQTDDDIKRQFQKNFCDMMQRSAGREILNILHGALIFTEFSISHMDNCLKRGERKKDLSEYLSGLMNPLIQKWKAGEPIDDYRMGIIFQYQYAMDDIMNIESIRMAKEQGEKILEKIREAQKMLLFHLVQHPDIPLDEMVKKTATILMDQ